MKRALKLYVRYAIVGLASNEIGCVIHILLIRFGLALRLAMRLLCDGGRLQYFMNWCCFFGDRGAHRLALTQESADVSQFAGRSSVFNRGSRTSAPLPRHIDRSIRFCIIRAIVKSGAGTAAIRGHFS